MLLLAIIGLNTLASPFHFFNANKLLALSFFISLFLLFKNINIGNNKIINAVSSTIFGVLLIHTNSNAMRQFLWKDVLNISGMYNDSLLIVHAIISVIAIFVISSMIEYLRIKYLEKPFLSWLDKKEKYNRLCDKYNKILPIQIIRNIMLSRLYTMLSLYDSNSSKYIFADY